MQEKAILIEHIDPLEIFGVNNKKFQQISSYFPRLKLVARGNQVKAIGDLDEIDRFENKMGLLIEHFNRYNRLTEGNIERLMEGDGDAVMKTSDTDDVIVFGNQGLKVRARTANQRKMVKASEENDMVFAIGPAGTGKTYTAVAIAVRALKNKEVRRIILTRPAVEAGESLGFLPGDLREKLDPYLQPLYDALRDMIPYERLNEYLEKGIIQIAPLAFMRGRTLDKAFVILDEAQNATMSQVKMFLTRMGQQAKFMITGDLTQIDLPRKHESGLEKALGFLEPIGGIEVVRLTDVDVIRHSLVKNIIKAFDENLSDSKKDNRR